MKHPITQSINNLFIYAGIWTLIAGVHVISMIYLYDLPLLICISDALVFNTIFAFLGVTLWFPVLYHEPKKYSFTNLLISHLSILSVTLLFWISTSIFILQLVYSSNVAYHHILESSIIWKIFTGTFFYFSLIMVYYLLISGYNLRDKIIQESRLRERVNEAELKALKSQINPHFLFNSLNSISALTLSDPEKAQSMIIKLSGFLRYSLAHDPNQLIALQQEVDNIESYIAVEKIRFGDKLIFEKNINACCLDHKVPFLILQPLIENAIKHGVYESTEPITLRLTCEPLADNKIKITVHNTVDPEAITRKGTGTGLKNITDRLKIIYQLNDLCTFEKSNNYFLVTLVIPSRVAFVPQGN